MKTEAQKLATSAGTRFVASQSGRALFTHKLKTAVGPYLVVELDRDGNVAEHWRGVEDETEARRFLDRTVSLYDGLDGFTTI